MEGIDFKVVFNVDNKLFFDALMIRKNVFVDEQNVDITEEIDDYDDKAYHVVGYLLAEPICCARIYIDVNKCYWGRVAVIKKYRKKKVGNKLIEFLKEYSKKELSASEVIIEAQLHSIDFYKNNGFEIIDEEIKVISNIEHKTMKLVL
ncbi:acetyltransferase, GNAT family protein [Spiroplasma litorale]|uniref:Acetyltransferase, GNAT family protein n=1 Tax=Spiroplasma litorale TaxID=216942 RepID=A0A0K1W257_9MOLU|nr:GNAT family N-acetyltransferase [Spiroplasma litorale]AKX34187.1 acetyltransferase, GNAT family protein [Spiroplasma litorale]